MEHATNADLMQQSPSPRIVAVAVDDEGERLKCLMDITGPSILKTIHLENAFFNAMHLFDDTYHGGWWNFFKLSNGGFYVALKDDKQFHMVSPNGFECDVDANTAGIIVSAFAYSNLSFNPKGGAFGEEYHKLYDFIFQHPEAGMIRAALD